MTSMTFDEVVRVFQAATAAGVAVTILAVVIISMVGFMLFYRERSARIASDSAAKTALTLFKLMLAYFVKDGQITPNAAADMETNAADPLYQAMLEFFDRDGLELLAANIGLDIEDVRDGPLPNLALRLKNLADRTGKHGLLVAAMQHARPGLLKDLR